MYATQRRLEVLAKKMELKACTDLPRSTHGEPVYSARKARLAILAAEKEARKQPPQVVRGGVVGPANTQG